MKGLLNQDNLFVVFEEGYQKNKENTKEFIKFLLDNSIEASHFLLKCNLIIETLTQNNPRAALLIDDSLKKIFKIFENTKKNIKNELKKALHLIISFLKSTYFEDRKKMKIDEALKFLSESWKHALDNEYRVTTNRREKIYDMINILESDYNTQKHPKINPHFLKESTVGKNSDFYAQSLSKCTYSKKDLKEENELKENENKTNLLNMDTSRDKIDLNFLKTRRTIDEVSNFLVTSDKTREQRNSKLTKGSYGDDVFMIDEYEEIHYQDNSSENLNGHNSGKLKESRFKNSKKSYRSHGMVKEEISSLRDTSESLLKSYDTEDLRIIRASKFRTKNNQEDLKKQSQEDYMVIDGGSSSLQISTPESQETQPKNYDTPGGFESQKLAKMRENKQPEIYYVNYKKKSKRKRKRSSSKRRSKRSSSKSSKHGESMKKKKSLQLETMKPLQIMVLKDETENIESTETENQTENEQSLMNLNESSIRSLSNGLFLQNPPQNNTNQLNFIKKNEAKLERILPENINESMKEGDVLGLQLMQNSDLHKKLNNIQVDFVRNQSQELNTFNQQSVMLQKSQTIVRKYQEIHEKDNNYFMPNLMGTNTATYSNSATSKGNHHSDNLYQITDEEKIHSKSKELSLRKNHQFSAQSNNIEKDFGTMESFSNTENHLSSVKKIFSPATNNNTDPFLYPSASGKKEPVVIPQQQNVQNFNPNLGNSSQITHSNLVKTLATNSLSNSELNKNLSPKSQSPKLEQSEKFFANESFGYPNFNNNHTFSSMHQHSPNKQLETVHSSQHVSNQLSGVSSAKSKKSKNSPLQRPFGSPNSNFVGLKDLSRVNEDGSESKSLISGRAFGDLAEDVVFKKNEYVEKDTKQFFAKFIVEEHNLGNNENCVVDTCEDGENLYIGGDKVYFFERGVNNYRQVGVSKILGEKHNYLKVYPDGRFITRCQKTNSLNLYNPSCQLLKTLEGQIYSKDENLPYFRMQEETKIILWRKSRTCLALVDFKDFKIVKTINSFWLFQDKNVKEIVAICDKKGDNILAISENLEDGSRIFHHYTKQRNTINARMDQLMPDLNHWYDIAMCLDQQEFFVAGTSSVNKQIGLLFAVFETTVPIKIATAIKVPDLNKAKRVQRITGTDLFLVACERDFLVSRYKKDIKKLELVNRIRSVGTESNIKDFIFKKYFCFSILENSSKLIILNFQPGKEKSPVKKGKLEIKDTMRISEFMNESFGVNASEIKDRRLSSDSFQNKEIGTERKEETPSTSQVVSTKRNIVKTEVEVKKDNFISVEKKIVESMEVTQHESRIKPPLPPRQSSEKKRKNQILKNSNESVTKKEEEEKQTEVTLEKKKPYLKKKRNIQRVKVSTSYEKSPKKNPNGSSKKNLPPLEKELGTTQATESQVSESKGNISVAKNVMEGNKNVITATESSVSNSFSENKRATHESLNSFSNNSKQKKKIVRQKTSVTVSKVQKSELSASNQNSASGFSLWKNTESGRTDTERMTSNKVTPSISAETEQSQKSSKRNSTFHSESQSQQQNNQPISTPFHNQNSLDQNGRISNESEFGIKEKIKLREVNSENRNLEQDNLRIKRERNTTGEVYGGIMNGISKRKIGQDFDSLEYKNPDDLISGLNVAPLGARITQQHSLKTFSQNTIVSNSSNSDLLKEGFNHVNDSQFVHGQKKRKITEIAIPEIHNLSLYNMIPTPSGHLLVFESNTNDAILISPTFEKIKRLKGVQDSEFLPPETSLECRRNYCNRITNEIVWINSQNSLKLIRMNDLSLKEINIFDENFVEEMDPFILHALYTSSQEVIVNCFIQDLLAIAYQKAGSFETDIHLIKDCSPQFEFIGGFDLSQDEKTLFVAGSSNFIEEFEVSEKGDALISALKVGPGMEEIVCQNLGQELGAVFCMKQYPNIPGSIFLGCYAGILEVRFNGESFDILNYVRISQKDIIIDFHICSNYPEEIFYLTKRAPSKIRNVRIIN